MTKKSVPPPSNLTEIYAACLEVGDCQEWTGKYHMGSPVFYSRSLPHGRLYVRRAAYEFRSGKPIPALHRVFDKCGNPRCVNAEHLVSLDRARAVSRVVKAANQVKRGAAISRAMRAKSKLTIELVREIRASAESNSELAKKYGVHHSNISLIRLNKAWRETYANPFAALLSGQKIQMGSRA